MHEHCSMHSWFATVQDGVRKARRVMLLLACLTKASHLEVPVKQGLLSRPLHGSACTSMCRYWSSVAHMPAKSSSMWSPPNGVHSAAQMSKYAAPHPSHQKLPHSTCGVSWPMAGPCAKRPSGKLCFLAWNPASLHHGPRRHVLCMLRQHASIRTGYSNMPPRPLHDAAMLCSHCSVWNLIGNRLHMHGPSCLCLPGQLPAQPPPTPQPQRA